MAKKKSVMTAKKGMSANARVTIAVLVVAVLVIGAVLLVNRSGSDTPSQRAGEVTADVLWRPDSNSLTTSPDNAVTVVEFLDYQCSACVSFYHNITKSLEQDYAGKITFVIRNFPLEMHPLAEPAAKAAEAASLQGKYQPMFSKLYGDFPAWALMADGRNVSDDTVRAQAKFESYAAEIGLDLAKFRSDMASPAVRQRIDQDKADGEKAGVTGTPAIFVNGSLFQPVARTYADASQQLRDEIDGALAA